MAIIQSILVGKGKGKIGNVVLSGLKGQTVAKQLNSSPSNPRTVAQTANRVKMANAVLAWQFLANFMGYAKGLRKPLESVYNAFVRTVVNDMSTTLASSRHLAAALALGLNKFVGNWFNVAISAATGDVVTAEFSTSGLSWGDSYRIVFIYFSQTSGLQKVFERELSLEEFQSGELSFSIADIADVNSCALYIYDSVSSKITNISYLEI